MNNVRGIFLVVFAMLAFAIEDMFVKQLTGTLSVGQVLLMVGGGSGILFALMALAKGQNLFARNAWTLTSFARIGCDLVGSIAFVTSLSLVDLSTVAAVFQATPLFVTMGAALFLGDPVGWRRWSAIFVGFSGVLLIIRPGLDGFDPASLWVLVAVLGVASRDLLTRRANPDIPTLVISVQGSLALFLAGILTLGVSGSGLLALGGGDGWRLGTAILCASAGYLGLVSALRMAEPSVVSPFRYSRLIFSLALGIFVLGERPDAFTILGAAIVISTGLYTFLRERRLAKAATA